MEKPHPSVCPHCGARVRAARSRCFMCGGSLIASYTAGSARVLHAGTPLRDRAGSPAAVVQTLRRGDRVELLDQDGSFVHVRTGSGLTGFVDAVNVDAAASPVGAAQPVPTSDAPADATPAAALAPAPMDAGTATAVLATDSERPRAAVATVFAEERSPDLPFGLPYIPGERLLYVGQFLFDPFDDRALVITSLRVIVGGGGMVLPRVFEMRDLTAWGLREGSNGLALGERTLVLDSALAAGEFYVSGLLDPERASACIDEARLALDGSLARATSASSEAADRLGKAWELFQSGAMEEDEYRREKSRILGGE